MNIREHRSSNFNFAPILMLCGFVVLAGMIFLQQDAKTIITDPEIDRVAVLAPLPQSKPVQATPEIVAAPPPMVSQSSRQLGYIDSAFTTLSRWQAAEVRPLLASATSSAVDDAQLQQVLSMLETKLGGLVSYDAPTRVPVVAPAQAVDDAAPAALTSYQFSAHYTEGDALVNLVLEQQQSALSLYHFDIQIDRAAAQTVAGTD